MSSTARRLAPLVGALLLLPFANGAHSVPLAAFLAPVLFLRFARTHRARVALPVLYVVLAASTKLQFLGMIPLGGAPYLALVAVHGLFFVAPYAADTLLGPRLGDGAARLFLFPTVATAIALAASYSPYGSWGNIAYSQYGNLALTQWLAVTGLWGIDFVIFAAAPVANRLWERGATAPAVRAAGVYGAVMALLLLAGGARLVLSSPPAKTVRIASLTHAALDGEPDDTLWGHVIDGTLSSAERAAFTRWARAVDDDLLARADREAAAGAELVFWDETGAPVLADDEAALVARGSELAARRHIYLGMALGRWTPGAPHPVANELVFIGPDGRTAWTYHKAHPVVGSESRLVASGDGILPTSDTPLGRISAIICHDADHPRLLRQAGALGAAIVLDPSEDWRAIDPWHTQMASFRAIEEGVTLVRHTNAGRSAVYDPHGVQLASMDHFRSREHVLVAEVPTTGVPTLYAHLGDWLGWLCVAAAVALVARALRRRGTARAVDEQRPAAATA
jgi:apolipoprotein N-acyltransferase